MYVGIFVKEVVVPQYTIKGILTITRFARLPEKLIAFPVGQCYGEEEGDSGPRRGEEDPIKLSPGIEGMKLSFFRI